MVKKVSALKARQNLGRVMNEVALTGDDYIVERAGKPLVAIVSMDKYEAMEKERMEALNALEQIWGKMKKERAEATKNAIGEAVKSVRRV
jgi:prevent-host-death family protein